MHNHNAEEQAQIINFREKLNEQRIEDFVKSLQSDDLNATRHNLITLLSDSLKALVATEQGFVKELFAEGSDGVCPSCLLMATIDVTRAETVAEAFNNYLVASSGEADCE